ncbi:hypothetical protein ABPG74_008160 [Tetrahymena malaccensis]
MILEEQKFYSFENFISQKEMLSHFSCLSLCFDYFFENEEFVELGQHLKKCRNAKKLTIDLSQKPFSQDGYQSLQQGLSYCINLENLVLFLNCRQIQILNACCIFESFESIKNLTNLTLNLSRTQFNGECIAILSKSLAICLSLVSLNLDLSQNYIGDSVSQIGNSLIKCTQLEYARIWLDNNSIGDDGISNFLEKYTKIKALLLYLTNNRIQYLGASSLSKNISQYKRLTVLVVNLYKNQIGKFGETEIKRRAYKLPRLVNSTLQHY